MTDISHKRKLACDDQADVVLVVEGAAKKAKTDSEATIPALPEPVLPQTIANDDVSAAGEPAATVTALVSAASTEEKKAPSSSDDESDDEDSGGEATTTKSLTAPATQTPPVGYYDDLTSQMDASWSTLLQAEFKKPYFAKIVSFLNLQHVQRRTLYPPKDKIFAAFRACPWDKVRIIILGQDCYFNAGQAEGLSFSVPIGVTIPSSLDNILNELEADLKSEFKRPSHGHLIKWAEQGVLLLNSTLTVTARQPNSHEKCGWQLFTDQVIRVLNAQKSNLVFMLWGAFAKKKQSLINKTKHLVLTAPHPSGRNDEQEHRFAGCRHFSKANNYLRSKRLTTIKW